MCNVYWTHSLYVLYIFVLIAYTYIHTLFLCIADVYSHVGVNLFLVFIIHCTPFTAYKLQMCACIRGCWSYLLMTLISDTNTPTMLRYTVPYLMVLYV